MNWQPIETAPKDGTEILIVGVYPDGMAGNVEAGFFDHDSGYWAGTYYDGYGYTYNNPEPTHWMPLPEPPESDQ